MNRCDLRRRLRRVPALHRRGPQPEGVDGRGLPLDHQHAPLARVRRDAIEDITPAALELLQANLAKRVFNGKPITPLTRNKILNVVHGIFARAKKVWGLPMNPAAELERHPGRNSGDIEVYSPEEIHALIRAAADDRDAAIYATAAFTGLRMGELRALRWRDVDFPRSVIRVRLAVLSGRDRFVSDDDLVFCEADGTWLNDNPLRRTPTSRRRCATCTTATAARRRSGWRRVPGPRRGGRVAQATRTPR